MKISKEKRIEIQNRAKEKAVTGTPRLDYLCYSLEQLVKFSEKEKRI